MTRIGLFVCVGLAVLSFISAVMHSSLLLDISHGLVIPESEDLTIRDWAEIREVLLALTLFTSVLATGVFLFIWSYRTNVNTRILFTNWMVFSPGWTIGWYFIPFANLWKPFQAMKELWRKCTSSKSSTSAGQGILSVWWATWIASQIAQNASTRISLRSKGLDSDLTALMLDMISDVLLLIASLALAAIVKRIQERHDAQQRVLESSGSPKLADELWA